MQHRSIHKHAYIKHRCQRKKGMKRERERERERERDTCLHTRFILQSYHENILQLTNSQQ